MNIVGAEGLSVNRIVASDGTVRVNTWYAGHLSHEVEPGAQAFLVGMETPFTHLRAHFHDVSQFQVFFSGSGSLGKDPLEPMAVFYTDAYASYGPIDAGPDGLSFFTLRYQHDAGVRFMPESRALRMPSVGRRILCRFDPAAAGNIADANVPGLLRRQAAASDEDGMRIEFLVAGPSTSLASLVDDGAPRQYILVLAGELVADGRVLRSRGMLYSEETVERCEIKTAESGVMLAIMTFPTPVTNRTVARAELTRATT